MRRRALGNRRGNAMVELALAVPMMLLLFAGAFQFGYYFYVFNELESAVRNGARYAALRPYDSNTVTPATDFSSAVQNMVVYGNPSGGSQPLVRGVSTSNVNLTVTMSNNVPSYMEVSISGITIDGIFGKWTLQGKPFAVFPYGGTLSPPSS